MPFLASLTWNFNGSLQGWTCPLFGTAVYINNDGDPAPGCFQATEFAIDGQGGTAPTLHWSDWGLPDDATINTLACDCKWKVQQVGGQPTPIAIGINAFVSDGFESNAAGSDTQVANALPSPWFTFSESQGGYHITKADTNLGFLTPFIRLGVGTLPLANPFQIRLDSVTFTLSYTTPPPPDNPSLLPFPLVGHHWPLLCGPGPGLIACNIPTRHADLRRRR